MQSDCGSRCFSIPDTSKTGDSLLLGRLRVVWQPVRQRQSIMDSKRQTFQPPFRRPEIPELFLQPIYFPAGVSERAALREPGERLEASCFGQMLSPEQ